MGGIGSDGARKNAGRKPIEDMPKSIISISLTAWQLDLIKDEASRRRQPVSNMITELLT
ncbi:MAG: hypothetical protein K2L14_03945 [Duncaniella sp.]|nr:hypothetical protein [Duncaniella sp.]MDE6484527.1 hypothetical protein [Duncaniella sp.]